MKAYVLVEGSITLDSLDSIRKVTGVLSADLVMGKYNVVAMIQGNEKNEVADVVRQIRNIGSVTATTTLIASY